MHLKKSLASIALVSAFLLPLVACPLIASAETPAGVGSAITKGLNDAATQSGYGQPGSTPDLPKVVGSLISSALALLGSLLLVLMIYAGYQWMTAGGDQKKVEEATKTIKNAIIGLVIVVAAYAISSYVVLQLSGALSGQKPA
jgi:amino acid transporter